MAQFTTQELANLPAEVRAKVEAMQATIASKAKARDGGVTAIKVSEKGAVSTYGLGRWPTTLYLSQLAPFAEAFERVLDFAIANGERLTVKENEDREALLARVKAVRERIAPVTTEQE